MLFTSVMTFPPIEKKTCKFEWPFGWGAKMTTYAFTVLKVFLQAGQYSSNNSEYESSLSTWFVSASKLFSSPKVSAAVSSQSELLADDAYSASMSYQNKKQRVFELNVMMGNLISYSKLLLKFRHIGNFGSVDFFKQFPPFFAMSFLLFLCLD